MSLLVALENPMIETPSFNAGTGFQSFPRKHGSLLRLLLDFIVDYLLKIELRSMHESLKDQEVAEQLP